MGVHINLEAKVNFRSIHLCFEIGLEMSGLYRMTCQKSQKINCFGLIYAGIISVSTTPGFCLRDKTQIFILACQRLC